MRGGDAFWARSDQGVPHAGIITSERDVLSDDGAVVDHKGEVIGMKIVVWKDGTWLRVENGITWEYENDPDWLVTIEESDDAPTT